MDFKLRPLLPRVKTATDFAPVRCPNCDRAFYPRRPSHTFCKTACRRAHWARHHTEPLPVYVVDEPTPSGLKPSDPQFFTKVQQEPFLTTEEVERARLIEGLKEIGLDGYIIDKES